MPDLGGKARRRRRLECDVHAENTVVGRPHRTDADSSSGLTLFDIRRLPRPSSTRLFIRHRPPAAQCIFCACSAPRGRERSGSTHASNALLNQLLDLTRARVRKPPITVPYSVLQALSMCKTISDRRGLRPGAARSTQYGALSALWREREHVVHKGLAQASAPRAPCFASDAESAA